MPSLVARPERFAADAWPLTRSSSTALSMSPPASSRAALQSIIAAPVRSRSAFTSWAPDRHQLPPPCSGVAGGLGSGRRGGLGRGLRRCWGCAAPSAAAAASAARAAAAASSASLRARSSSSRLRLPPPRPGAWPPPRRDAWPRLAVGVGGVLDRGADGADHELARAHRVVVAGDRELDPAPGRRSSRPGRGSGSRRRVASATAIASVFRSMISAACGSRFMSRTPPRLYSSFSSSASIDMRSLVGSSSSWPSSLSAVSSCRRSIRADIVWKLVSRPPSQRWFT